MGILFKIDNYFNKFINSAIGKFIIDKILFRKKSFYSVLSFLITLLIAELSSFWYSEQLSIKIQVNIEQSQGFIKAFWYIFDFLLPNGNIYIIGLTIILLGIIFFLRNKELNQNKSIEKTLIAPLKAKTKNILFWIKTNIPFNNKSIEIDRKNEIKNIQEKLEEKQVIIISGDGGVGKTAIVKKLYSDENTFYAVKAIEFKEKDIFYGHNIQEFIDAHKDFKDKIFVIDSAEKLLDIENQEFFKEFLSALIQNNWKIIFTTRNNYLDDLNYEFTETYSLNPCHITINNLSVDDLQKLSKTYNFRIPVDEKLVNLILNPFYLNQFLQEYNKSNRESYLSFKAKLWNKLIFKSKPNREKCFLDLAYKRANDGFFFVDIDCEENILKQLVDDGIIRYESNGYFITHDIYEEWALEKIIEKEFTNRENEISFFKKIGSSLPIRRSFRDWVSEKLLLTDENIKSFIEKVIANEDIEQFWKDEILISVLLSEYSDTFFESFENKLFYNDAQLLKRISFLLRIACKEADNSLLEPYRLNIDTIDVFSMFNKSKGNGWESFIKIVYKHKDELRLKYLDFILPVLKEWQTTNQKGVITRKSVLLALYYYNLINKLEYKYDYNEHISTLCNIIITGSYEIQDEIQEIFELIIQNKWKYHGDNYYELSTTILSTECGIPKAFLILKYFPDYVFKIANLFWSYVPKELPKGVLGGYDREEVETAFGIEKYGGLSYFPDSALQTPIYYLLRLHQNKTVDFIIDFMNKCIEKYSKSGWEDVVKVEVIIDENLKIKQYHSQALWNMYRGTSSPVMPVLLKCIHMALEKYILEMAENTQQEILETFLKYLLSKSKSSSISAIVASIVLAYPDKTFNIAKFLLKTKEFIRTDFIRQIKDNSEAKFLYGMGYGMNASTKEYQDERLKTCKNKHRNSHLESLFLNYQLFRNEGISEEEADNRQKVLWKILDHYYSELPQPNEQTETEKTWSITLARMDRRKQDIEVERVEKGVQLTFKSKLEPEIEKYSKDSQKESSETLKFTNLTLWSKYRLENNQDYEKYTNFEENPLLAIKQLKEILNLKEEDKDPLIQNEIFSDAAVVLLRDFSQKLNSRDMDFCKDLLLKLAMIPLQENYNYQISDGSDSAIANLPLLFQYFPDLKDDIKLILLLNLFRDNEISKSGKNVYDNAIDAIVSYYEVEEIKFFILGYLFLKPVFDKAYKELREKNWQVEFWEIVEKFSEKYEDDIKKFIESMLIFDDIKDISVFNIRSLIVVFKIISRKEQLENIDEIQKILIQIVEVFQTEIFNDDKNDGFEIIQKFIDSFSNVLLNTEEHNIKIYLQPFIENFKPTEDIASFFTQLILVQDRVNRYDNFWKIWNIFEDVIIKTCENGDRYWDIKKVIYSYMLVWSPYGAIWKKDTKEWHSLKERDKRFYVRLSNKIGHCPSVLYSISFSLNSIGYNFLNDGVDWLSSMIQKNSFLDKELEVNTIYYLEQVSRRYILNNIQNIKKEKAKKEEILVILNFLVEKGSALGYKIRERIL